MTYKRAASTPHKSDRKLCTTTDEVILTDEVSTIRFVAARLSPLKEYCVSIVCTPGDVTSRQESWPTWLFGNLAVD